MSGHTPGPWEQSRGNRGTLCVISETTWICGEIENPNNPMSEEEALANARLIASAPELLEALKAEMLARMDNEYNDLLADIQEGVDPKHTEIRRQQIDFARAAIAKATSKDND